MLATSHQQQIEPRFRQQNDRGDGHDKGFRGRGGRRHGGGLDAQASASIAYPPDDVPNEEFTAADLPFAEIFNIVERALEINGKKNSAAEKLGETLSSIIGVPLLLFGSTIYKGALDNSDADYCAFVPELKCCHTSTAKLCMNCRADVMDTLDKWRQSIRTDPSRRFRAVNLIPAKIVPILELIDRETGIHADLAINGTQVRVLRLITKASLLQSFLFPE